MKISLIQMDVCYKNKAENLERLRHFLRSADDLGDLVLLPELFTTGYLFETPTEIHALSETTTDGATVKALQALATEYNLSLIHISEPTRPY